MKTQAIIVREVEREVHEAREERATNDKPGLGQTPDQTYGQIGAVILQIQAYFDQIVQVNPNDLMAPRISNLVTQLWQLIQQYNTEVMTMLQDASAKVAACQSTSAQTSTQLQQAQASSGISPSETAAIAVGSAIGGGILGYLVRAKMKS